MSPTLSDVIPTQTAEATATAEDPQIISLAAATYGGLTLVRSAEAPAMTQQEAMQAVTDCWAPWGLGTAYGGRTPVVSATFGLATFGDRALDGQWIGVRNIQLPDGQCLDHIENRPMWIIDYGNTVGIGSGGSFNHTVYAVDDETDSVFLAWFYNVDSEQPANSLDGSDLKSTPLASPAVP